MARSAQAAKLQLGERGPPTMNSGCVPESKYGELLVTIEELGKDIRPSYAGSKSAMERLKRGIMRARGLVQECLAETERNARSQL
ncbi:cyclin-dependent kinase 2-associated protein 1 isoform X2 [Narcine bancroftii]|uniref:cyclin-dependent kinase 2-associated protein 1 isoform X2 n=1 Tax=Narcine bancroftii TaxID=1343680 RepID=UPI003831EEE7